MDALNPLVAGVTMKLAAASKTAEIDSRAIERATRSAQPWVELFCCFFIALLGLNQFSCFAAGFTGLRIAEISRQFRAEPRTIPREALCTAASLRLTEVSIWVWRSI